MAYEVIKRVGNRAYRYNVESRRDPQTGKLRPRWRYLGVVPDAGGDEARKPPSARRTPRDTRSRLLDAFERVAEREPYAALTAGAITKEAGLAHGTFYRYFRDKRDLFESALERVREDLAVISPSFEPPYRSREDERRRMGAWLTAIFEKPAEHPGVMRAFYEMLESDADLRAARDGRRRERVERLAGYLTALAAANLISPVRAEPLATALMTLVEATFRAESGAARPSGSAAVAGALEMVDRAIFGVGYEPLGLSSDATLELENGVEAAARMAEAGNSAMPTRSPVS